MPEAAAGPPGWTPSSVHDILKRSLYAGAIPWKKRNQWGQYKQSIRSGTEWITIPAPELRIVSEAVWEAVRARLGGLRAHLEQAAGKPLGGRRRDIDSVSDAGILALWGLRRRAVRDDPRAR